MSGRLLVVTAPGPGRVTARRWDGDLSPTAVAELAAAFLADTLRVASHPAVGADVSLAFDGPPDTFSATPRAREKYQSSLCSTKF